MNEYTIFDHAQLGHVDSTEPCRDCKGACEPGHCRRLAANWPIPTRRVCWAVEAGLGLGPQFKDKRYP